MGKFEPSQAVFAYVSDANGADAYTTQRLGEFIRAQGADHSVYKTDQESALKKYVAEAIFQLNRTAEFIPNAVPEHLAVGESQSNGVAERNVQKCEDLL